MSAGRRARLPPRDPTTHHPTARDPTARDPTAHHPTAGARRASAAALCAAALYAALASGVKPFTVLAYAAVALPSVLCVGVLVAQRSRPGTGPWRRMDPARPASEGTGIPWLVVIVVLLGIELASYFHPGPRADYPTLSFGLNALLRHRAAKAAGWLAWLVLGWYLVRR